MIVSRRYRMVRSHIPVDKVIVNGKLHDEVDQRLLDARGCSRILHSIARLAAKEAD